MKKETDDIARIFSSKLKNYEVDVPDTVWNQLSDKLDAGKYPIVKPPKTNRKRFLWSLVAVASVLLLLFLFNQNRFNLSLNMPSYTQKDIKQTTPGSSSIPNYTSKKDTIVSKEEIFQKKNISSKRLSRNNSPIFTNRLRNSEVLTDNQKTKDSIVEVRKDKKEREKTRYSATELARKTTEFSNAAEREADRLFANKGVEVKKMKKSRTLNLMAGGGLGLATQSQTANQFLSLDATSSASILQNDGVTTTTRSSKSTYQLNHSLPVTFSVGVTKPLSDIFSLDIGLSISYLYSSQKGSSSSSMRQSQQFYYLGLPMSLRCRIATRDKLQLSVAVGGSLQKDIVGRIKQNVQSSSSSEKSSTSIYQKYLQPSFNADLHIMYLLGKRIGLYGKLGGAYYFNMNDNYNTIYSDKSFLPDISVGLSYELNY